MEVSITEFRNNVSKYFDKVYFERENLILNRRGYKLKLTYEIDEVIQDEINFDDAIKSKQIKDELILLASKL